mmetsp:Transcript_15478/g.18645  ORF Transcript_15478/g.18645 Transcript_15478/m.18645 type:complete len:232 (-) Transcript_15478:464-1159(-)
MVEHHLIDLNVPLTSLLPFLKSLLPVDSLGFSNTFHSSEDTRHHSLESAEVDVCTEVHELEDFLSVFLNLILDVHLTAALVLLLTGKRNVVAELFRVFLLHCLPVFIVKKSIGIGNTKEEPCESLELFCCLSVLNEETAEESTVWCNTSTSCKHDNRSFRFLLRHQHNLSSRSGKSKFSTRLSITQVVGADTLLSRILLSKLRIPVGCAAHTEGHGLTSEVISITGGSDGV